ncbi:heme ABC exporter ATP-binding protein CcmA [Frigidibacter sp. ROC022]|uniref:heme ABC exporter ATP-binding protein CcmA n=1 Tax=Frigidibacter sp. ROC022 TaxID=2971796 RepID=UPI00215A3CDC|nr:heme ABC exporter ATP-binding protein CcmA [Frigidibacter sp. ROC022]MCR8726360.1 heme ABC exporter ATP-binding protein CcmA [Frigidibacter sp. ROC022]
MNALLEAEELSVGRGGVTLLQGLSFAVAQGEALVLRGPNGCGKTTLIRALAGLQPVLAGELRGAEAVYAGHLDGIKAQLTVAENLQFWARVMGGGGIDAALAAFDLGALADRPARNLSAGQKRRLGLARLLLAGRPLWLLDEPTVSLDSASVGAFAGVVESHLAGGGAAVIATHVDLGLSGRDLDLRPFRALTQAADAFGDGW